MSYLLVISSIFEPVVRYEWDLLFFFYVHNLVQVRRIHFEHNRGAPNINPLYWEPFTDTVNHNNIVSTIPNENRLRTALRRSRFRRSELGIGGAKRVTLSVGLPMNWFRFSFFFSTRKFDKFPTDKTHSSVHRPNRVGVEVV